MLERLVEDDGESYAAGDDEQVRIPNGLVVEYWEWLSTVDGLSAENRRRIFRATMRLAFARVN